MQTSSPQFKDDFKTFDKNKLEAIQTAWHEEWADRTKS